MSLSFGEDIIRFIVLVIPGLWGLWVYKPFLMRSTEEVVWDKDLAIALSFGLPGYLFINSSSFLAAWPIAAQVLLSSFIAICIAVIAGKLHRAGKHPTHYLAKRDSEKRGLSVDVPYDKGIPFIFGNLIEEEGLREGRTAVALIYSLGKKQDALIGEVIFRGERSNEIVIGCRPEITLEQVEKNHWNIHPWVRNINLDSGIVVEIANIENEILTEFQRDYDELKSKEFEYNI